MTTRTSEAARTESPFATFVPSRRERIVALDGLRGVAVLLVSGLHLFFSEKYWFSKHLVGAGWVGVNLFFVLSGFLITRILLSTAQEPDFFRSFYRRRALRIWPLYYVVLIFAFLCTRALPHSMVIQPALAPYYITFTQNLFMPRSFGPWALSGTWSLAIEEQFYLFWPLCVRCLPQRKITMLLVALILLAPIIRFFMLLAGLPPVAVYLSSVLRLDELAAGSLGAVLLESKFRDRVIAMSRTYGLTALVGGALLCTTVSGHSAVVSSKPTTHLNALALTATYTLLAVGFAAIVFLTSLSALGILGRLLENIQLRFIGRISFGIYLIQGIVIPLSQAFIRPLLAQAIRHAWLVTLLLIMLECLGILGLSIISWRLLELPAQRLDSHWRRQRSAQNARADARSESEH